MKRRGFLQLLGLSGISAGLLNKVKIEEKDSKVLENPSTTYHYASGMDLTVNETGLYEITYQCTFYNNGYLNTETYKEFKNLKRCESISLRDLARFKKKEILLDKSGIVAWRVEWNIY